MADVLIKPLRSYEDRGKVRKRNDDPYPAPQSLAKELMQQGLCEIVGEAPVESAEEPEKPPTKPQAKPSAKAKDS